MEIIKEEERIIIKSDSEIESYDFNSEINFKKLIDYLLKKNLSEKIDLECHVNEPTEAEDNLIKLIQKIVDDYNSKVNDLEAFVNDNKEGNKEN